MNIALSSELMTQLSLFVAARVGLHFPRERWSDLAVGLASAAREKGAVDEEEYARWLLSAVLTRQEVETLASHLTVGETYFFREKGSFDALERRVLPELIRARRSAGMRLRIWSAACCTGEEAYSIAMLLDRMIPDLSDWNITILATDINPRFLEKASAGIYREWSFRVAPPGIKESYFSSAEGGTLRIAERIRNMVTFSFLNLAEDVYPSLVNNTNAMDVVLCRNVLMYFTPHNVARVVAGLHETLVDNGWLLVAPSEASQVLYEKFTSVGFPDATFYRKLATAQTALSIPNESAAVYPDFLIPEESLPIQDEVLYQAPPVASASVERAPRVLDAQELANHGDLEEALSWFNRAIAADALNPALRFLRAMVAQEQGSLEEAVRFLKQVLYLDAGFVMAHFALGNLAKRLGRPQQSRKYFRHVLTLLDELAPDAPIPEAGGLTAERLTEIIHSTMDGGGGKA